MTSGDSRNCLPTPDICASDPAPKATLIKLSMNAKKNCSRTPTKYAPSGRQPPAPGETGGLVPSLRGQETRHVQGETTC